MQKGKTHRSPFLVNIIKVQSFSIFFHFFIMRELLSLEERIKAVRNVINNSTTAAKSPIIAEAVLSTLSVYLLKNKEKMLSLSNNQFNSNIHFRNNQLKVDLDILNGVLEDEKKFQKRFPDSLELYRREAVVQIRAIAFSTVEFLIGVRRGILRKDKQSSEVHQFIIITTPADMQPPIKGQAKDDNGGAFCRYTPKFCNVHGVSCTRFGGGIVSRAYSMGFARSCSTRNYLV